MFRKLLFYLLLYATVSPVLLKKDGDNKDEENAEDDNMILTDDEEIINWSPIKIVAAPDLTKEDPLKRAEDRSDEPDSDDNKMKVIDALDGDILKLIDSKLREKYPHLYDKVRNEFQDVQPEPPIAIAPFENKEKEIVEESEG